MTVSIHIAYILLLALTCLCACVLSVYTYVQLKRQARRHELLISILRNEIGAMTNSTIGMGKRVMTMEQELSVASKKQQALENRDPGMLAYNQAAKLMEMGASADDLVRSCGIGRPEAELMALLHRELRHHESLPRS